MSSSATPMFVSYLLFFFFNDTATTKIYTLSLHDALPILVATNAAGGLNLGYDPADLMVLSDQDRKSTRLNSSHLGISYAVFCLKKQIKARSSMRPTRLRRSSSTPRGSFYSQ